MNLNESISGAIDYIEENLTEKLDIQEISGRAYLSCFYFQKVFYALCGLTVGEYIRNRRLSLAAQELCSKDAKVLDIALKYGYGSSESFSKAFTKFHGIAPSAVKSSERPLRFFAPLKISLTLEGGQMPEYSIVEKEQFTVVGKSRVFSAETAYQDIPEFWDEFSHSEDGKKLYGMYGICLDNNGTSFEYLIADKYSSGTAVPEGFVTRVIPKGTWAVFPCRGPLPETLQAVNTQIWNHWLQTCRFYRLAGNYDVEAYGAPYGENLKSEQNEIWIPVERIP